MAAYAALSSLINTIHHILQHPHLSTSLDNTHIQPLLHKANFLLHFMEANNHGGGSREAEYLEMEISAVAHMAEEVIESHIVDQIQAGIGLGCSLDLRQNIQDMDYVMKRADEFMGKHGSGEEQQTQVARPVMEFGETSTAMVGLDADLDQLLHELTGHQSSRHTISIVGMGGTGKTTLAKNMFQHPRTKEHFHCRTWATISQQHNASEILSQLLSGLEIANASDLGLTLHQTLTGRRYLIVLDDIWSVQAWNEVKRFFPDNKNGSRVVLTTRLSNVANDCQSSPLVMNLLDEVESWKLFCEKAFKNEPCPAELMKVGKKIVKLCKGLALSIVVMGGLLLNSPRTVEHWKIVVRDIKSISHSKVKEESLDVLSLSYTHLPPHLKPCFLYMGMFEEDSEIRVSNVVQLWVAEGFIKPTESRVWEEIAEGYLEDLIDRNLISVSRRHKNGNIKCCGIHDLLRDLCLKVSKEKHVFRITYWESYYMRGWTERHLVSEMVPFPLARSIIARSDHSGYMPDNCRLLRVCCQGIGDSAGELYEKVNLRYLSYQLPHGDTQKEIPTSIALIWNLQTLIIEACEVDAPWDTPVFVPIEVWKMRQLRHVECHMIYLPWSNEQDELLILDNLQTLKLVVNFRLSEDVCKIIPNITKLHLLYSPKYHGYDDCLIEHLYNLAQLHKLKSLSLNIDMGTQLKKILRFPSSLNKLSLRNCGLEWEDMTVIGSLPHLEVLLLEPFSVYGREWSPVNGEFRRLKFLKIYWAYELEDWNADKSHFPALEKLVLGSCVRLKEIPLDIGEIPTLQLIRVDRDCSISAAVSAVRIKEEQLENLGDDAALEVQLRMRHSDVVSLKEMVSINNVQLQIV